MKLTVVRRNREANTFGPVLEFLGTNLNGHGEMRVWLCSEETGGPAFPVKLESFTEHYVAYPLPEPAPVVTTETVERRYAVVYARGAAHLQGLDEVPRDYGTNDAPAYTYSACPALTTNKVGWVTHWEGTDLTEALAQLETCGKHVATSACKKCTKTGNAQLEAQTSKVA